MTAPPPTAMTEMHPTATGAPANSLPRLLGGIPAHGATSLEQHVAHHGPLPHVRDGRRRRARERAEMLIDEVERSGLLGHGGAAFPMAKKMRAVAQASGRAIVVANGAEGEPPSRKDRTLLELAPHLVLDGAILAAEALGAEEAIIAVGDSADAAVQSVERAIAEYADRGDGAPRPVLATVPTRYLAGQESALINHLGGGPAKPTFTPPMPFEQGLRRRPTLINNVETLAHLALIARHGAPWFRWLGTDKEPGSALVTLSGPVAGPGVYEIEHGASLSSLLEAAGGTTAGVCGVLLGGYAGTWIPAEEMHGMYLSREHLAPHGATLGAGVVLLLSDQACPVAETARVARWLADQSARQCGPCMFGLDALAGTIEQIAAGTARGRVGNEVERLAALTTRRGACSHPDGSVRLIVSAVRAFKTDFASHMRHGPCDRCSRPAELPLPGAGTGGQAASRSRSRT